MGYFKKYVFGETAVYYIETPVEGHEGKTTVGLAAYPVGWTVAQPEALRCDSLIQVAFTGDETLIDYTRGVTMRNRDSTLLRVESQTADGEGVVTVLSDGKGNFYTHRLRYCAGSGVFSVSVVYENCTARVRTLELLSGISLSGISLPSQEGGSTCGLTLHRMTSAWSRECRLKSDRFSSLGLDMSWARYGVKCERWGQTGSMSNRGWYPFAAIEDESLGLIWGFTMEAPFSWQMETYLEKESCAFSGGLADYEFGHWRKEIPVGGSFRTHEAFFTVKRGGVNDVCNAFLRESDARLSVPPSEESMPVIFNEYCTTWGNPAQENIQKILRALKGLPIGTFVIDAGWYKPEDKGWCNAIGDWNANRELFPAGMKAVAEQINAAGMKAGIWFEFENAGRDAELFGREELLLKRDGALLTCKNRRFLDLRLPAVEDYLQEKLVGFLKENKFSYLKIDYNDSIGIGADGAESLGEGGRQVAEESIAWLDKLRAAIDGLVLENCASGGSRIEPLRMGKVSMCSFSDAHECTEIPLVAANVSRVVPARQMQIWAVLREQDGISRTVYSLCAAMLGRICLSGDVIGMTEEKRALLAAGLAFYDRIKEIVRRGEIAVLDCDVEYYREPVGRQIYAKEYDGRRLVVIHRLLSLAPVTVSLSGYRLKEAFTDREYSFADGQLTFSGGEDGAFTAGAFLFEKVLADD